MWRCVTQPSAEALGRGIPSPRKAIGLQIYIPTFHHGAAAAAAAPLDTCGCSQKQHLVAVWAARPRHRTSRPVTTLAAVDSESGTKSAGSGSSSSSGDAQRLQPKPQARLRRLSAPGSENTPSKPRRWHRASPSLKSGGQSASATGPQPQQQAEQDVSHTGQGNPHAQAAATTSGRDGSLQRPQQQRQVQKQKPGRQQPQQPQRGPGRRGQPPSGSAGTLGRKQQPKRYGDDAGFEEDMEEEEEEGEDGEFLGLSAEELEAMVFASAGLGTDASTTGSAAESDASASAAGPSTASASSKRQRQAGKAASAAAAPAAADVLAAASLPLELAPWVEAAIRSGGVTSDGSILADQLRQLRDAAAALAAPGGDAGTPAATATNSAVADTLQASAKAAADLLGCSNEAAAAILVNHPRYVGLLAAGGAGGEALELLRSFSGMLKLDLPQTRDVVRQNPALLLLPYEPLREKLVALANATGLSLAQATTLVSPYMFAGL